MTNKTAEELATSLNEFIARGVFDTDDNEAFSFIAGLPFRILSALSAAEQRGYERGRGEVTEAKDNAYWERNQCVAALSKCFPAWMERHPDSDTTWEDDWRWIVFMQLPTGQVSWHIHDSELQNFSHLEQRDGNSWDGHTTEQKYLRLSAIPGAYKIGRGLRSALSKIQSWIASKDSELTPCENECLRIATESLEGTTESDDYQRGLRDGRVEGLMEAADILRSLQPMYFGAIHIVLGGAISVMGERIKEAQG